MKIYLAIPYTNFEEQSYKLANKIAASLLNNGYMVFSPISHAHSIAQENKLPGGWDFWEKLDTTFIDWCDAIYVIVPKDGGSTRVQNSSGVKAEIEIGIKLGKDIVYIEEVDYVEPKYDINKYNYNCTTLLPNMEKSELNSSST